MLNKTKIQNNKAQVGDTIMWFVATIAVVVILAISIFSVSFAFSNGGGVKNIKTTDVLASKSLLSYTLTKDDGGKTIYEQIKQDKFFSEANGNLSIEVFSGYYSNEYSKVWLGVIDNQGLSSENSFFGRRGFGVKEEFSPSSPHVSQTIKLDEQNNLNLMLYGKK
ncbi:MAG: hypothetical protein AABX68_00855 [Nanoarchaeota archaeon]